MNVHCFQHVPFEGLGRIASWAQARGHRVTDTRFFETAAPPPPETVDMLVIMGGPMNVYEYRTHPWLRTEKRFIERFLSRGGAGVGVCLGAQLFADVLGAKVYQNAEREIGWFPVRWRPGRETRRLLGKGAGESPVFHWHGDTFDLPAGAAWLAETEACAHQGFLFERRILGLQFHLEVGRTEMAALLKHVAKELAPGRFVQSLARIRCVPRSVSASHALLWKLLDRLNQP
jgi:GMP synthase-like glutamine amidotransferase